MAGMETVRGYDWYDGAASLGTGSSVYDRTIYWANHVGYLVVFALLLCDSKYRAWTWKCAQSGGLGTLYVVLNVVHTINHIFFPHGTLFAFNTMCGEVAFHVWLPTLGAAVLGLPVHPMYTAVGLVCSLLSCAIGVAAMGDDKYMIAHIESDTLFTFLAWTMIPMLFGASVTPLRCAAAAAISAVLWYITHLMYLSSGYLRVIYDTDFIDQSFYTIVVYALLKTTQTKGKTA